MQRVINDSDERKEVILTQATSNKSLISMLHTLQNDLTDNALNYKKHLEKKMDRVFKNQRTLLSGWILDKFK